MYYIRDMRTLAERLIWARERKELTQEALAKRAGVSQSTIGNLEAGLRQTARKILDIASALDVDPAWLADGKGTPDAPAGAQNATEADGDDNSDSPFIEEPERRRGGGVFPGAGPNSVAIPRIKLRLRAGVASYDTEPDMDEDGYVHIAQELLDALKLNPANLRVVRVRGPSMEPMMFEDDPVVIDLSDKKPINREIYAVNWNGEALIKQLIYRGNEWYLHSTNPDFGPVNVRSGQCSIVARVVIQPTRALTGRL